MRARGLYVNTHAGQSLREGGLAWAVDKYDPDFIVLVEVGRFLARRRVRKMFPDSEWSITGLEPTNGLMVESGTLIIAKRSVLKRKDWRNPIISKQRWIGPLRDKWHPIRRLTRGVYVFRDNPKIELEIGADHAWTYAGWAINDHHIVPSEHCRQIRRFAAAAFAADSRDAAVLDIGDMNEHVPAKGKPYVQHEMNLKGMRALVRHKLDYVFGNRKVVLEDFEIVRKELITTDHDGIVIDVKVFA